MQEQAWEREYKAKQMLSPSNVPHAEVVRFAKWLRKRRRREDPGFSFAGARVLDLGSGTGRNAFYFAERGAAVVGYEISDTALAASRAFAKDAGLTIDYRKQDIGSPYPAETASVDIVLDATSSNSLTDAGRAVYLAETKRVLVPGGILFVRALSLEADKNAKELVARFPGADPDTYVHPDLGLTEKTFTRASFMETYGSNFTILELSRAEHYSTVAGRKYKRQYWIAYLQK